MGNSESKISRKDFLKGQVTIYNAELIKICSHISSVNACDKKLCMHTRRNVV